MQAATQGNKNCKDTKTLWTLWTRTHFLCRYKKAHSKVIKTQQFCFSGDYILMQTHLSLLHSTFAIFYKKIPLNPTHLTFTSSIKYEPFSTFSDN